MPSKMDEVKQQLIVDLMQQPCKHHHNFFFPWLGERFQYVCARDLGIWGGLIFLPLIIAFWPEAVSWIQELSLDVLLLCSGLLTLPLVIDWWLQCKAIRHSTNWRRLLTGLLASLGIMKLLIAYRYLFITIPVAFLWGLLITKIGRYWWIRRPPEWGCPSCRTGALGRRFQESLEEKQVSE